MALDMSYEDGVREIDAFFATPPTSPEALGERQSILIPGMLAEDEMSHLYAQSVLAAHNVDEFEMPMKRIDQKIAEDIEQIAMDDPAAEPRIADSDTDTRDLPSSADNEGTQVEVGKNSEIDVPQLSKQQEVRAPVEESPVNFSEQHDEEPPPAQLQQITHYRPPSDLFSSPLRGPHDSSDLRHAPHIELGEAHLLSGRAQSSHQLPSHDVLVASPRQQGAEPLSSGGKTELFAEMRDEDDGSHSGDQALVEATVLDAQTDVGGGADARAWGKSLNAPGSALRSEGSPTSFNVAGTPLPLREIEAAEGLARLSQANVLLPFASSLSGHLQFSSGDEMQGMSGEAQAQEEGEGVALGRVDSPVISPEVPTKRQKRDNQRVTKPQSRRGRTTAKQEGRGQDQADLVPAARDYRAAIPTRQIQKPIPAASSLAHGELSSERTVPSTLKRLPLRNTRKRKASAGPGTTEEGLLAPATEPDDGIKIETATRRRTGNSRLGKAEIRMMQYNTLLGQYVGSAPRQTRRRREEYNKGAETASEATKTGNGRTTPTEDANIMPSTSGKKASSAKEAVTKKITSTQMASEEDDAPILEISATTPAARIRMSGTFRLSEREMKGLMDDGLLAGDLGSEPGKTRFQKGEEAKWAPNASKAAKARHWGKGI